MTALINIENLHYRPESFPLEKPDILCGISLEINPGDFIAILGKNGSGKTTLIKHINCLLLPTKGRVLFNGADSRDPDHQRTICGRIGMVFQNPADQIVASTVEEDVAFGLENANLPTEEIRQRVYEVLESVGLQEEAKRPPHLLSGGQIQRLALAGVLARRPSVILFDEPTSMLDPASREAFMARIRELHQTGKTIIYITQHMEEAVNADQVVVLEGGKVLLKGTPQEIFSQSDKLYEVGLEIPETLVLAKGFRELGWDIPANVFTPDALLASLPSYTGRAWDTTKTSKMTEDENIISFRNVHYTYLAGTPLAKKALQGVDLDVSTDSIHGIAGANGSGKSTLLQHINGILRPSHGSVHVDQFKLENSQTPLREVIKKVGLVFQSPENQFFKVFVGDEIAYGPKQFEMVDVRERVREAMNLVGLDFEAFKDRRLETLSGGEKRKVALASTLVLDQDILLFDEPSAGMDPSSRSDLLDLFKQLNDQGKTILIASHRLEELAEVSQDISIMRNGQNVQTGPIQKVLFDNKVIKQTGLKPPLSVKVSQVLVQNGWPIKGSDTSTPGRLMKALRGLEK